MFKLLLSPVSLIFAVLLANPAYAQITWNNVNSTVPDTSRQMGAARDSMNSAFDQLRGVINAQEENDRANWNAVKNNNTQEYLDAVYSYTTVKDLLANREVLERKRMSYGAQIDQGVARNAIEARLYALMRLEQLMATGR